LMDPVLLRDSGLGPECVGCKASREARRAMNTNRLWALVAEWHDQRRCFEGYLVRAAAERLCQEYLRWPANVKSRYVYNAVQDAREWLKPRMEDEEKQRAQLHEVMGVRPFKRGRV